ncbi:hypothetical protein BST61_g9951 [Cercospora zeina]
MIFGPLRGAKNAMYLSAAYIPSNPMPSHQELVPSAMTSPQSVASVAPTGASSAYDTNPINGLPTPTSDVQKLAKKGSCSSGGLLIACPEDAPELPHYTLNGKPTPTGNNALLAFGRLGQNLFKELTYKPPVFAGTKTLQKAARRTPAPLA